MKSRPPIFPLNKIIQTFGPPDNTHYTSENLPHAVVIYIPVRTYAVQSLGITGEHAAMCGFVR